MKYKAILIIGQTASGKTALAHTLFDKLKENNIQCEIVNLDAFQIYKDVSIGTSKPTSEEQQKYHYHGIDLCGAHETMDANIFAEFAQKACQEITNRGHLPICVGGSGLYLRAFLHGLDKFPPHDPEIRQKIRNYAQEHGWDKCYEWLFKIDPVRAKELHPNDHVRIERAIEIFEITKIPASVLQSKTEILSKQDANFDAFVIHTTIDNESLRKKIFERTKLLFEMGWVDEVNDLFKRYGEELASFNAMRAIGYKAILSAISQECSVIPRLDRGIQPLKMEFLPLIEQISNETAKYAKRQKTWNKKEKLDFLFNINHPDEIHNLLTAVMKFCS